MSTITSKWRLLVLLALFALALGAVALTWGRASFQSAAAADSEAPASVELMSTKQVWHVEAKAWAFAADRLVVHFATTTQDPRKVDGVLFQCDTGEAVWVKEPKQVLKNFDGPGEHREVWSANFQTKCIDPALGQGALVHAHPVDPSNKLVIKDASVQNTSTEAGINATAEATGFHATYRLTSQANFATNRVEIDVGRLDLDAKLSSAIFVCSTTDEVVIVPEPKPQDDYSNPTPTPFPYFEVWSADFATKCIPPGGTVDVTLFPFSPDNQGVIKRARVVNTLVKYGNLTDVYDIEVTAGPSVVFHCIARADHDPVTNQMDFAAKCYSDIEGSELFGHLVDGADGASGPPPPPPFSTTPPTNLDGAYDPGTDTITLQGCFTDLGGIFAPHTYVEIELIDAKELLPVGTVSGTISLYPGRQALVSCENGEPTGEMSPFVLPITARKGSFLPLIAPRTDPFDYDGDGCSDWEELDKTGARPKSCGDDPYNPQDSDAEISGIFWARATVQSADWDTENGELIPGSYFFCINRVVEEEDKAVSADVWCAWNSPAVSQASGTGLPPCGDGTSEPLECLEGYAYAHLTGVVDNQENRVLLGGCFADVGGPPVGPNVIINLDVDVHSGQGDVDVWIGQSNFACEVAAGGGAGRPSAAGALPPIIADLGLGSQPPGFDSDGDGTSDDEDFNAGRNPASPGGADKNLGGTSDVKIELARADVGVPGSYWRCRANTDHDKGTNDLETRIYCYFDDPAITVNSEEAGAETCGPAPAEACGDGYRSGPPPRAGVAASFGDVDQAHTVLLGQYNKPAEQFELTGCFEDIENSQLGPNIYVEFAVNDNSREGLADIWLNRPNCDPPLPGTATHPDKPIEMTAVGEDADRDLDGCPDKQELGDVEGEGGLRDPYNKWDFYDIDGNLTINLFGDIFGVAFAFGTGEPGRPNAHPDYDEMLDRGGAIEGSNAWNQKPPDGKIDLFNDIFGVAFQFGHRCI